MILKNKTKIVSWGLMFLFVIATMTAGFFQLCLKPDGTKQFEFIFEECSDHFEENTETCTSCDCHNHSNSTDTEEKGISETGKCLCEHMPLQSQDFYIETAQDDQLVSFNNIELKSEGAFSVSTVQEKSPGRSPPKIINPNLTFLGTVIHRT